MSSEINQVAHESVRIEDLILLRQDIRSLIANLSESVSIAVHHRVNQSYYMQKAEELTLLLSQIADAQNKLDDVWRRVNVHHGEIYRQWREDIEWIQNSAAQSS